jgi:phospholipase C
MEFQMRAKNKRWFVRTAVLVAGSGLLVPVVGASGVASASEHELETRTPIEHTIIVYGENISFDHYFGTYEHGSNGIPAGGQLFHTNSTTGTVYGPYVPTKLDGQTQSITCDVDHGYKDMLSMVDHGAMDQFLNFGNDKTTLGSGTVANSATCASFEANPTGSALAMAYYEGRAGDPSSPVQTLWNLADNYVLGDNFFQAMSGPSTPGAEWLAAATSNTTGDPNPIGDVCNDYAPSIAPQAIPNVGEAASAKGISWAWFQGGFADCVNQVGTNGLTNPNLTGYSAHHDPFQYFSSTADLTHQWALDPRLDYADPAKHQRDLSVFDAALTGAKIGGKRVQLPAISYVKADFSQDSHPGYSGPAAEDAFVKDLVAKVKSSKYWESTAIIFAYDETGGWWDHVAPPVKTGLRAPYNADGTPNTANGCDYPPSPTATCALGGKGPRMPFLVVSPYAKKGFVLQDQLDTTSLVKWVEWNYELPGLGLSDQRDVNAPNILNAFSFRHTDG